MDRLETIGLSQLARNFAFRDYRDMVEGRLVIADFDDSITTLDDIRNFRKEEMELPTFLKHFDIIGIIVNQLSGEFDKQKTLLRVDSIDPFSQSEYLREKDTQIRKFTEDYFNLELKRLLVLRGVNPEKKDFQSQEEREQYTQQLQAEQDKLIPPDQIENNLSKSFRTVMTEWGQRVLEADYLKFDLADADLEELRDYLLTGRYFRHYHIGLDYYKPDTNSSRWIPETTFFSQDLGIVFPQDGEYVGQITWMSVADVLSRYGEKIPEKIQRELYSDKAVGQTKRNVGFMGQLKGMFSDTHIIPDKAYYQRDLARKFQGVLDVPFGKEYRLGEDGELEARSSWIDDDNRSYYQNYAQYLRKDIDVRDDSVQVIEAYWRSFKRMGLLTIQNDLLDDVQQIIVEEDLLKDYIKENNIKQYKTISLKEAKEKKEVNTLAWFYLPQVWKGKKLNAGNSFLSEDFYFDIEPLEFQIKENGEFFDVKLPVAGIITSSLAQKIRPYQQAYNYAMNMIENSMEKHIGAFLMFDFNFLPSQYKNEAGDTTRELIEEFTQKIKDIGFGFYDSSPQNTQGQNPNQNQILQHSISFVEDMQYYAAMADKYKALAYEQIGMNPQRLGNPSEYMTAEGVKQGVDASYAQTERIYKRFNTAKRREAEIHLAVAQYCVQDVENIPLHYTDKDGNRIVRKFVDKDFHFRSIDIIPINDSEQRKNLEVFRAAIMNNNTINNDMLDYAKVIGSKSFKVLMDHAALNRKKTEEQVQADRQHQQQMLDKQIQAKQQEKMTDQQFLADQNQKDRENDLREAEIQAIAKVADNNADASFMDKIQQVADENIKQEQANDKLKLQEREVKRKEDKDEAELALHLKNSNIELEKLKLRREENETKRFTSIINKN